VLDLTHPTPTQPRRTVRVRAMLVIDADGVWCIEGWAEADDADMKHLLNSNWRDADLNSLPWAYHIIEADVPVPVAKPETAIEGSVSDAE
jgi:hypothetical protein